MYQKKVDIAACGEFLKEPMSFISKYCKRDTIEKGKYIIKLDLTEEEEKERESWLKSQEKGGCEDSLLREWDEFTSGVRKNMD
jgi:hypothetical protein